MACSFQLATVVVLVCYLVMSNQEGTTPNLQETFKKRCRSYSIRPPVNCDDLWNHFSSPWIYTSPCGARVPDYGGLFRYLPEKVPKDKTLFWSGTKEYAHKLSKNKKRYITLEDTLVGSVADGLVWCGQTSAPGIQYTDCPKYGSCAAEPRKTFWDAASRWFASQAVGDVSVVLNGSNPSKVAYNRSSTFGSVEVPGLRSSSVTKLTAIVVYDLGKPKIESCTSQSLGNLRSDVRAKNIQFDCYEQSGGMAVILGPADTLARLPVITTMAISLMINFR